jgi:hypothetical protein
MQSCRFARDRPADVRVVGGAVVQIVRPPPECDVLTKAPDRAGVAKRMLAAGAGATSTECGFADQRKCPWFEAR